MTRLLIGQGKPAPDIYRYACEKLQLAPERTFAVEDSPNGIRSAYAAGCHVIMVPDLTGPDEELSRMLYACVGSLTDIRELFKDYSRNGGCGFAASDHG